MPNHCSNDLFVRGKKALLAKFKKHASITNTEGELLPIDCNQFIPYPKKYRELDAKARDAHERLERGEITKEVAWAFKDGFNSGGYEWCCKHWGTKWGVYDCALVSENNKQLRYGFDSAWSPPRPVVLKMSEMFPELEFDLRYFEAGGGFKGKYVCIGGKVTHHEESEYHGSRGG